MVSSLNKILIGSMAATSAIFGAVAQSISGCITLTPSFVIEPAVAEAWVNIGGFACGNPEDGADVAEIDHQIAMVARAAAESIADIMSLCHISGRSPVRTEGSAIATARAEAYGTAITNVFAENDACPNCTAGVDALVRTSQLLIAEATARSWIQFTLTGSSSEFEAVIESLEIGVEDISEAVAEVLASVTGTLRSSAQQGCSTDLDPSAQVDEFFAPCNLSASGPNRTIQTDVIGAVALEAQAFACGRGMAEMDQESLSRAAARALADAVVQAEVMCQSNVREATRACGFAQAEVEDIARAQAVVFAEIFASASLCGCDTEQHVEAEAIAKVWSDASARAYAEACVMGALNIPDFAQDFERGVMARMQVATAQVIVSAIVEATSDGETCNLNLRPCTVVSQCAERNHPCRGADIDGVIPCCLLSQQCFRLTETESRCLARDRPLPVRGFIPGDIDEFPVCDPEDNL